MYKKAYEYCKWAVQSDNNRVPKYVKKQCSQFIDIWEDKDELSIIDHNKATKFINYYSLLTYLKGRA